MTPGSGPALGERTGPARARVLALHAEYHCRQSGNCCVTGWEIPIEPQVEVRLRSALRSGALRPPRDAGGRNARAQDPPSADACLEGREGLPHGSRSVLGRDACGRCRFLETAGANLCAIHRQLGEDALPSACRHFPRVARLTPRGVDVTLSHACVTVAALPFRTGPDSHDVLPDPLLRVVGNAPAFPAGRGYEGLDARDAVPPLLRPGVLMSWRGLEIWEAHAVAALAAPGAPEAAVDRLAADAERLRVWTPRDGDFDAFLDGTLTRGSTAAPTRPAGADAGQTAMTDSMGSARTSLALWDELAATVPTPYRTRADALALPPEERAEPRLARVASLVAEGWRVSRVPIRRWLASKAFGSWLALQGEGLRTSVLGLRVDLGVLHAAALAACAQAARPLDQELLRQAFGRADRLLLHLADPEALAGRLSGCERQRHARPGGTYGLRRGSGAC